MTSYFYYYYCLKDELDRTAEVWNAHVISPSKNENVPHGRPNVMYFVPELYNTQNYTHGIAQDDLDECMAERRFLSLHVYHGRETPFFAT